MSLRALPSLDELLRDPARAAELPVDAARALYARASALTGALLVRSMAADPAENGRPHASGDRLLGPADVAARIGKSRSWVEKNTDELPPRRRVGGEGRWSESEIEAWIRSRPRWREE